MKILTVFQNGDGSHQSLTDWYPEKDRAIRRAISGRGDFSTGWYRSKHAEGVARVGRICGTYSIKVAKEPDADLDMSAVYTPPKGSPPEDIYLRLVRLIDGLHHGLMKGEKV